ncbi:MAG: RNA polymerase sigma factor [Pseudomonadota bacterium]
MHDEVTAQIARMAPRLRRFAWALCGDRDEADDLVQAACLKALSRLHQFRPGTRLDGWMFRIVQTTHLDEVRRRRRAGVPAGEEALERLSDHGQATGRAEDRMTLARVRGAMSELPAEQRAVLALVAIEGLAYREAAEVLGIPVGTVMSRLARARARLAPLAREDAP